MDFRNESRRQGGYKERRGGEQEAQSLDVAALGARVPRTTCESFEPD